MKRKSKASIKTVTFRANTPITDKYQHVHVEVSADVPPGEQPGDVLDMLKEFVARELKIAKEGEPMPAFSTRRRFRV